MTNKHFDDFMAAWERKQIVPTNKILIRAVQNYVHFRDDDIIVVDEVMADITVHDWQEFIQFMHTAGLKKFFFGERSTACLPMLTALMTCGNVQIAETYNLKRMGWGNKIQYVTGLLVKIPERRG